MAANYPINRAGKFKLQPGARGEAFEADLPGYRGQGERRNRTNNHLGLSQHDAPNIKYDIDRRLPVLFRHTFAMGYNQLVATKGRIMAIDPYMNQLDFDTHKSLNVLTLANGGNLVKLRDSDKKQWEPAAEAYKTSASGEQIYMSGVVDMTTAKATIDDKTGKVAINGEVRDDYRIGNVPAGMLIRNEYTRDDNAFNGMQPGAIFTDTMAELPFFMLKEKAEENPWGSAYGNILPGDLLKPDANGRLCVSPLSRPDLIADMTVAQYEAERQQVVGQVYEVSRDLVPAGAAKYAEWALEDRMNYEGFNPYMWRINGRRGEDLNETSPYKAHGGGAINGKINTTGNDPFEPTGYGYDNTILEHDLHMLASTARRSDNRLGLEFQLEQGIPGLTDGYNVYSKKHGPENCGFLRKAQDVNSYIPISFKTSELGIEKGSLELAVTTKSKSQLTDADFTSVTVSGQKLKPYIGDASLESACLTVNYMEEKQGFFQITISDPTAFHQSNLTPDMTLNVYARYSKRGLSGVPTFMDWDGCCGFISILLQK